MGQHLNCLYAIKQPIALQLKLREASPEFGALGRRGPFNHVVADCDKDARMAKRLLTRFVRRQSNPSQPVREVFAQTILFEQVEIVMRLHEWQKGFAEFRQFTLAATSRSDIGVQLGANANERRNGNVEFGNEGPLQRPASTLIIV